jgi:hypothetical protein
VYPYQNENAEGQRILVTIFLVEILQVKMDSEMLIWDEEQGQQQIHMWRDGHMEELKLGSETMWKCMFMFDIEYENILSNASLPIVHLLFQQFSVVHRL